MLRPDRRRLLTLPLALPALAGPAAARAGLPDVVAVARRAVFPVGTYNALDNPRFSFRGSGFAVGDGRLLATNAHVLPTDPAALARMALLVSSQRTAGADGAASAPVRKLTLLAQDRTHDLALLQIDGEPLPTLPLAADDSAREGQAAAFIGFPIGGLLGFSPVTHRATVSSITPIALPPPTAARLDAAAVARLRQGSFDIYQLDGTAYPGNSGGPLLDADSGEVLGLINMVLVKAGRESLLSQPSGISYAIPVRFLRALMAAR